ncbi:MAG: hypothetical protein DA328_02800 [Nitrososphaeraceae archaeon]|nr:hypothetical protein [Nitrososphaeraceae archaeon]
MSVELKIHPSFFKEFATKTWVSPYEIVKELIENAFDEDATKVLITLIDNGDIIIEDDAGMDKAGIEKFLLLGSPHKKVDSVSPKYNRIRTGRYGTGRLSFLTSFERMKIKTKKGSFSKVFALDSNSLDDLFTGNSKLDEINEKQLKRNGTELRLENPKMVVDSDKLLKEIRKLAILRQPMFEISFKRSDSFREWNFDNAQLITAPEIQGYKIPVNIENGKIYGEIIIARRPLSEDERGIGIMVGNHIVTRSHFGFENKINKVTGLIRCNALTSRFADKSAIIEDDEYNSFNNLMREFILNTVIPSLGEYEDVLITKEESRIYKEIDKALGQAVMETLETFEEVGGYETVLDDGQSVKNTDIVSRETDKVQIPSPSQSLADTQQKIETDNDSKKRDSLLYSADDAVIDRLYSKHHVEDRDRTRTDIFDKDYLNVSRSGELLQDNKSMEARKIRKPVLKKTFVLKKIGYKVIPYDDESDSRYSFTNENIVFVNKANSTYKAEALRGDEFLLRHIIRLVAEAIAESKHPEGKDALELQNRLITEAIRIHDVSGKK